MDNPQNIWTLLLTYSFIQGYIIGAYALFWLKDALMAVLEWMIATLILAYLYYYFEWMRDYPAFIFWEASLWYTIGPLFYFLIKRQFGQSIPKWEYALHAIPFLVFLAYIFPFYAQSGVDKLNAFLQYAAIEQYDGDPNHYYFSFHRLIYLIGCLFLFKKYHHNQKSLSTHPSIIFDQLALKILYYYIAFSVGALLFYVILDWNYATFFAYYPILYLFLSVFIHILFFYVLVKPKAAKIRQETKYQTSKLSKNDMQKIFKLVQEYIQTPSIYSNPTLRLQQIADDLKIPTHHISQSISEIAATNFFDLVNQQRVKALKENLNKDQYKNFTLVAIANEHGFNSPSSFYRIFKKYTGQTPKQYLKQIQAQELKNTK